MSLCGLLRAGLDGSIRTGSRSGVRVRAGHGARSITLSDRLAVSLLGLGLTRGDRIASLMPNCPALIVHYVACLRAGLVATPLNYRYTAPEIDHALAVSGARALFSHVERRGRSGGEQACRAASWARSAMEASQEGSGLVE